MYDNFGKQKTDTTQVRPYNPKIELTGIGRPNKHSYFPKFLTLVKFMKANLLHQKMEFELTQNVYVSTLSLRGPCLSSLRNVCV